jgi:hypothetical protein
MNDNLCGKTEKDINKIRAQGYDCHINE